MWVPPLLFEKSYLGSSRTMSMKSLSFVFLVACCSVSLSACDLFDSGPDGARIQSVSVDSSAGPLLRWLEVKLDRPARVEVNYAAAGTEPLRVITDEALSTQKIFLPRLRSSRNYLFSVVPVSSEAPTVAGTFRTGALPDDVAQLRFTPARGTSTAPLYFVEIMITNNGFNGALIVDAAGEVVWYWRSEAWITGADRRANGNFLLMEEGPGLLELTPDQRIVRRLDNGQDKPYGIIHHDAIVTPQNTVYFLARDRKVIRDTTVVGEALWEWTPETDVVAKRWSSFDDMDWDTERAPASAPQNWLHSNSLFIGPRGNVVVSHRNLDQVISIKSDFSGLEWRLGGPGATITPAVADQFFGQHSAAEVAPNRVLVFDNGFGRGLESWSRVTEFQIDPVNHTATKIWEFRPSPDNNAVRVGAVNRLANGNTTASFGWGQGSPIVVYEVRPDGSVAFELVASEMMNRMYRARPLQSVGGETAVGN